MTSFSQDIYIQPAFSKVNPIKNVDINFGTEYIGNFNSRYEVGMAFNFKTNGGFSLNFKNEIYVSTDSILSNNDLLLSSITGNVDSPANCSGCTFGTNIRPVFDCNNNLESGKYFYIIKLDADNKLKETNENNNIGYFAFQYQKYNCGVVNVRLQTPKSNYAKGESVNTNFFIDLENTSSEDFSLFGIQPKFYLSSDLLLENNDILISSGNVILQNINDRTPCSDPLFSSVTAKARSSYFDNTYTFCSSFSLVIPASITEGTYYILLKLDQDNPSYIKYVSNPIQIGNITTELEKDILTDQTRFETKQAFDLTGREIDINNASGKLLIVTSKTGARKIMYVE